MIANLVDSTAPPESVLTAAIALTVPMPALHPNAHGSNGPGIVNLHHVASQCCWTRANYRYNHWFYSHK